MKEQIPVKICILTAARSEYGLLRPIIQKMKQDPYFDVRVAVTGMHLSPEFGLTYREIEEDGIEIDRKIEMLLSADSPAAISKSMALATIGFAEYFEERRPELLLILGDRYEALAVAEAAMNAHIPIIHLSGGDVTEGAVDDVVRHCLTKMSLLHFVATEQHRKRVIQLGEDPERVFRVGAMSVESALSVERMSRDILTKELGFDWREDQLAVVTYHPVTLGSSSAEEQCKNLLEALDEIPHLKIIFTKANADADGRAINRMLDEYVAKNLEKACVFTSLGQKRYISAIALADVVVGNSSSGLSEVPSFHIPIVNVGERQKGRECGRTVISCPNKKDEIKRAVIKALSEEFKAAVMLEENPYGMIGTSDVMISILKEYLSTHSLQLMKKFYDLS